MKYHDLDYHDQVYLALGPHEIKQGKVIRAGIEMVEVEVQREDYSHATYPIWREDGGPTSGQWPWLVGACRDSRFFRRCLKEIATGHRVIVLRSEVALVNWLSPPTFLVNEVKGDHFVAYPMNELRPHLKFSLADGQEYPANTKADHYVAGVLFEQP